MCLIHSIGGAFTKQPEELSSKLSVKASDLIKRAFDDIDSSRLVDHHVHIAGLGVGGTKAFVNAKMLTWRHPFHRLKFKVYMSSAGVDDESNADSQVINRLARLVRHIHGHGKHRLLAFDKREHPDQNASPRETGLPRERGWRVSARDL